MRTLPSTLIKRCITILVTSAPFKAYFKRFLKKIIIGKDSRNLCGPVDGRGAKTPPNLSNIHALGAAKRFKCFLGPRAYNAISHKFKKEQTLTINCFLWTFAYKIILQKPLPSLTSITLTSFLSYNQFFCLINNQIYYTLLKFKHFHAMAFLSNNYIFLTLLYWVIEISFNFVTFFVVLIGWQRI